MKLRNFTIAATIAALVLAIAAPATATGGGTATTTCDDLISGTGWEAKVNVTGDHGTIAYTAPTGFEVDQYCVKTGSDNQEGYGPVLVDVTPASGSVTIDYPEPPADAGKQKSISHYIVHLVSSTDDPETPQRPLDGVEYGDWVEDWECGDDVVTLERSFTSTGWELVEGAWSPVLSSGLERDERPLTEEEIASCDDVPPNPPVDICDNVEGAQSEVPAGMVEKNGLCSTPDDSTPPDTSTPRTPDIDGSVVAEHCTADAPYLRYEIVVNDPDGVLAGKDTATITFINPNGKNWTTTVKVGAGMQLWPGATVDASGKATAWPGWQYDAKLGTWVDVGNDNFGWTRAELTQVKVQINPSKTFYVNYPKATPGCASAPSSQVLVVAEVSNDTPPTVTPRTETLSDTSSNAPAAAPVKAEVAYTG